MSSSGLSLTESFDSKVRVSMINAGAPPSSVPAPPGSTPRLTAHETIPVSRDCPRRYTTLCVRERDQSQGCSALDAQVCAA